MILSVTCERCGKSRTKRLRSQRSAIDAAFPGWDIWRGVEVCDDCLPIVGFRDPDEGKPRMDRLESVEPKLERAIVTAFAAVAKRR